MNELTKDVAEMIGEDLVNILKGNGWTIEAIHELFGTRKGHRYIVELEWCAEDENISYVADIEFDGSARDFLENFWNESVLFNEDEFVIGQTPKHSHGCMPGTIKGLLQDAETIKTLLRGTAMAITSAMA